MKKICNIYNYPSHYRKPIYKLLDQTYDCTFVFGDEKLNIKPFEINELKHAAIYHVIQAGHLSFSKGILKYIFKKYDYYIITMATNDITHWLFFLFGKLFKSKKIYVWGHGLYGDETKNQIRIRKMYLSLIDGIFVYGDYAKKIMIKAGYNENKIIAIHNSLDYSNQLSIRKVLKETDLYSQYFGNTNPVLLFIGRLTSVKKLDQLIEAVHILKLDGQFFNLVFVGDGEEQVKLDALIHKYGLEKSTWFYGACYDEQTNASLIYNADICVSPGNVGLTSIHCFTFGTPVITHNNFCKQMPEFEVIKDNETGGFFEMDNVQSLANSISQWFNNHKDRAFVRKKCYAVIDGEWNPNYQIEVIKGTFN